MCFLRIDRNLYSIVSTLLILLLLLLISMTNKISVRIEYFNTISMTNKNNNNRDIEGTYNIFCIPTLYYKQNLLNKRFINFVGLGWKLSKKISKQNAKQLIC